MKKNILKRILNRLFCYLMVVTLLLSILLKDKIFIVLNTIALIYLTYLSVTVEAKLEALEELDEIFAEITKKKGNEEKK